jgi:hypothetical protein
MRNGLSVSLLVSGLVVAACSSSPTRTSVGTTPTTSGRSCEGFDTTGDGKADEVDCNGDGIADGEDVDGDGVATVWDDLTAGLLDPPDFGDLEAPEPDELDELDPEHPPQRLGSGGAIELPPTVTANVAPELLKPLQQGQQESCAAFASAVVGLAAAVSREGGDPNASWPSQQYLYQRQLEASFPNEKKCAGGTFLHEGLNTLVREGAPSMADVPYDGAVESVCKLNASNPSGNRFRIGGWLPIVKPSRDTIKKALAAGLVVPFGVQLPEGFTTLHGAPAKQVYKGAGQCANSKHCGGHAMVIVGYDDARNAFRVLNSWGTDWGDGGYLWWDYDSLVGRAGFHAFQVTLAPSAPPFGDAAPQAQVVGSAWDDAAKTLTVRVAFSQPLGLNAATARASNASSQLPIPPNATAWLWYGDVPFDMAARPSGVIALSFAGRTRSGGAVSLEATTTLPQ